MSHKTKHDRDIERFAREMANGNGSPPLPKFNTQQAAETLSMAAPDDLMPMHDLVLVEKLTQSRKTKSGLVIPDHEDPEARSTVLRGVVVAVGDGRWSPYFEWRPPMGLEVGDIIVLAFHPSMPPLQWDADGRTFYAIREPDVQIKYRGKARLAEEVDGASQSVEDAEIAWVPSAEAATES